MDVLETFPAHRLMLAVMHIKARHKRCCILVCEPAATPSTSVSGYQSTASSPGIEVLTRRAVASNALHLRNGIGWCGQLPARRLACAL